MNEEQAVQTSEVEVSESPKPKRPSRAKQRTPEQELQTELTKTKQALAELEAELAHAKEKSSMYFKELVQLQADVEAASRSRDNAYKNFSTILNSAFDNLVQLTMK